MNVASVMSIKKEKLRPFFGFTITVLLHGINPNLVLREEPWVKQTGHARGNHNGH